MKASLNLLFAGLLHLSGAVAFTRRADGIDDSVDGTTYIPNKYIVELSDDSDRDAIIKEIEALPGSKIVKQFKSSLFNGFSVESESSNADALQAINPTIRAWNSQLIKLYPTIQGSDFSSDAAAPEYEIHNMTGVDKLHQAGLFGKGVVVGVVDTGTDWAHPALGGCFGDGCKVVGGYDFVGDDTYWPYPGYPKIPDEDPMDQAGHGTHVAGIIAGKSEHFTGVAPEASIYSYKIFGSSDGTDEETIIEAFLRAYEDGVDIVSASVGSTGGWDNTAWATVANRIVDEGIFVAIAAGNSGNGGPFFMSSGAAARGPLAVASVEASMASARRFEATFTTPTGGSNTSVLGYRPAEQPFPRDLVGWPIFPISLNTSAENEACEPLPEDLDLTGVIPLVRVGGCQDMRKEMHLNQRNATFILMYMDDGPLVTWSGGGWVQSDWGLISAEAGEAIIGTIAAGGNVTVDFSLDPNTHQVGFFNSVEGGKPSVFTSWGPNFDLALKPDVAAPGGRILSTYPGNRYREFSGTSMATPYISGIAALYIGKYGGRSQHGADFAHRLNGRIAASGRAVPFVGENGEESGFWAPPAQVGTGLVDALAVLEYDTELSYVKWALNDTRSFSRYHKVDITNHGDEDVEYRFSLQAAAGFETQFTDASEASMAPRIKDLIELEPVSIEPDVTLPSRGFKVPAGQTRTAQVNFKPVTGVNPKRLPLFSGKVLISGSNGDELSVPYLGLAGDLKRDLDDIFYSQANYPRIVSGVNATVIGESPQFTFNLSLDQQDFPKLQTIFRYGTHEFRWDIFEANYREHEWKYPPVPGQNKFVGAATSFDWQSSTNFPNFDPASDDANNTWSFPMAALSREIPLQAWWLGKLADGTTIKPGRYSMRVAALLPFGNPYASDNWRIFRTPVFQVV